MNEFNGVSGFELCSALQRALQFHEIAFGNGNLAELSKNANYIRKLLAECETRVKSLEGEQNAYHYR